MKNQILDIKFKNDIITITKHTQWNFVNIILTIIDNCNDFKSPYANLLNSKNEIYFNINLNLDMILNYMVQEIQNTKNNFLNLITWIFLSNKSININKLCDSEQKLSKFGYTQKYTFINRLYKIKYIKLCTLLNRISREIDKKGYIYTKIINKNIILIINKYICNWYKFNCDHWIYEKKYNNIYKKILKKIDYYEVYMSLKKNENKNILKPGTLKYIKINYNKINELLPKIKFLKIQTSDNHCLALTENGYIYGWGSNNFGQLGMGEDTKKINVPTKLIVNCNNKKIIDISVGFSTSSIITEDNNLYSCGCNENGRIGIPCKSKILNNSKLCLEFNKIDINYNIVKLKSGSMHQCAIDDNHKIYSWGSRFYVGSRYLHSDRYNPNFQIYFFKKNNILIDKISIGPGGYHTLALSISGDVYGWGHNGNYQLGQHSLDSYYNEYEEKIEKVPIKLKFFTNKKKFYIKDIICGWSCTYILDYLGNVYVCGRNNENELGIEKSECIHSSCFYRSKMIKHKHLINIDKIYNFKETVFLINSEKKILSVGRINKITSEQWSNYYKGHKFLIRSLNKINNFTELSYQSSKKKIYFIE